MTRGIIIALALLLVSAAAHVEAAGRDMTLIAGTSWYRAQETSQIDDSSNVYIVTEALSNTEGTLGLPVIPELHVNCTENVTDVYIYWHTFLDMDDVLVTLRIDDLPAKQVRWGVSTDFEAAGLWEGTGIGFLQSLFGHKRLLARVTPYGDNAQTAVFDITGLETVIEPLMEACHWGTTARARVTPQKATPEDELQQEARLSVGEIDALMRQIGDCWMLPAGIDGIEEMVVRLRIQVRPDRTVQSVTIEDQSRLNRDPKFRAVAESARQAVEGCSPLNLPADKYPLWRNIVMNFYPEYAIGG